MYTKAKLLLDLYYASRGIRFLNRIKRRVTYESEDPLLVFFPEHENRFYEIFNDSYDDYIKVNQSVVILSDDHEIKNKIAGDERFVFIMLSERNKKDIERGFALGLGYQKFWYMSITSPEERNCEHIIGVNGITFEQLIIEGIFECRYDSC